MSDLESLCNTIYTDIRGYVAEIDEAGNDSIPSKVQLSAYRLMRELLELSSDLAASLRYDLQHDHTNCQTHDSLMARKLVRIRGELSKMGQ